MAIKVVCQACFQEYSLRDESAGKTVRCKECRETISVPGFARAARKPTPRKAASKPAYEEDSFEMPDEFSQPAVERPAPKKAVKKKRRETSASSIRLKVPDFLAANPVLWSVGTLYALGFIASASVPGAARTCIIVSALGWWCVLFWGGLKLIRVMVDEHILCLLLSMFLPGYGAWYVLSRWDRCSGPIFIHCVALLFGVGSFFLFTGAEKISHHLPATAQLAGEIANIPAADVASPFPLASIPVPAYPELDAPTMLPATGVAIYNVALTGGSGPGSRMRMRLYLPPGTHAAGSLACVLVGPAGTNLMTGANLDDGDYHDETLPYAIAGHVALAFSLDGDLGVDLQHATLTQLAAAYAQFNAAMAGLVNARNALEFVLAKVPQVDRNRIFVAGHSSAGTLALLFAEHEPRLAGCIAYAPCSDVETRLRDFTRDPASARLPGLQDFVKRSSPLTHAARIQCRVFLFHARDDTNLPLSESAAFAARLLQLNKRVQFAQVATGNHYQSMIDQGIPQAIQWIQPAPTTATPVVAPRRVGGPVGF